MYWELVVLGMDFVELQVDLSWVEFELGYNLEFCIVGCGQFMFVYQECFDYVGWNVWCFFWVFGNGDFGNVQFVEEICF